MRGGIVLPRFAASSKNSPFSPGVRFLDQIPENGDIGWEATNFGVRDPKIKSMAKLASVQPVSIAGPAMAATKRKTVLKEHVFSRSFMLKLAPFTALFSAFHRFGQVFWPARYS
jgi:hypothetical protein